MFRHCLPLQDEVRAVHFCVTSDGVCWISDPTVLSLAPNDGSNSKNVGYRDCKTCPGHFSLFFSEARTTEAAKVTKSCNVSTSRFPLWKPPPSSHVSLHTNVLKIVTSGGNLKKYIKYYAAMMGLVSSIFRYSIYPCWTPPHCHIGSQSGGTSKSPRSFSSAVINKSWREKRWKKNIPKKRRGKIEHPTKKVREDKTSSQKGWGRIKHGQKRWRKHQNQKKERIISTLKMQCPGCWDVQCKWPAALKATWMRIYRIEVVKKLRLRVFVKKDKS